MQKTGIQHLTDFSKSVSKQIQIVMKILLFQLLSDREKLLKFYIVASYGSWDAAMW
jgi:hypothetical protein